MKVIAYACEHNKDPGKGRFFYHHPKISGKSSSFLAGLWPFTAEMARPSAEPGGAEAAGEWIQSVWMEKLV